MIGLVSFVLVFGILIFTHELGHFVAAKLARVRVSEFGFGYPPRLVRLGEWHGTTFSINALPFGGFARMAEDDPSVEGSLAGKPRRARAFVYVAGVLMNALLAVSLFSGTYMVGTLMPVQGEGAGIYMVSAGSPADLAGIKPGDTIVRIDGAPVPSFQDAMQRILAKAGHSVEIVIRRDGAELPPLTVTPRLNPPANEGALGVALDLPLQKRSYPIWQAVPMGIRSTYYAVRTIFVSIRAAIRKQLPFQVTGIVGIYSMTTEVAKSGLERLIEFTAWLSLNLALFNLLPLPALDGGRLIFVLLEWLRRGRRVAPEKEGLVHAVGMVVLIGLMVVVSVFDYIRFFG